MSRLPLQRMLPHYEGGRFYNYPGEEIKSIILPSAAMYLKRWWGKNIFNTQALKEWLSFNENLTISCPTMPLHSAPSITWIGHASFLIQFPHCNILLDPVFDNITLLFPRYTAPGISRTHLPQIDLVLISHNHRDHLEKTTISYLAKTYNPIFYVPQGDGATLRSWGAEQVVQSTWWDRHIYPKHVWDKQTTSSLELTFLPARHWSRRGLFDTNKSLWGSWMISSGEYHCYFAGDTAYGEHFRVIAQEFPRIHTALMPIGPCDPSSFLSKTHVNAEQAGLAFLELNAEHFIPMHWGTFGFGIERQLAPIERLMNWWNTNDALRERHCNLHLMRVGQQISHTQPQPLEFKRMIDNNLAL